MKLISIELKEFIPMSLTRKKYFKLEPKEIIQVILGTNGSGKTSLIREIVPGATARELYRKNGAKRAIYEHNHKTYIISYDAASNEHRLTEDGKELNESGNFKDQENLIFRLFGINNFVRSLITGEIRFSQLGPQKRRELFTAMSPVSFDYGLDFYTKTKESLNSTSAALRRTKKQLVEEIQKVVTDEQYQELIDKNKELHKELSILFNEKAPIAQNSEELLHIQEHAYQSLSELVGRVFSLELTPPLGMKIEGLEALELEIRACGEKLSAKESLLKDRSAQYESLKQKLASVTNIGNNSLQEVKAKIEQLQTEQKQLLLNLKGQYESTQYEALASGIESHTYLKLEEIFSTLPLNDDLQYSNTEFTKLKERFNVTITKLQEHGITRTRLQTQIAEIEKHQSDPMTVCPQCSHKWIVGFDPHNLQALKTALEKLNQDIFSLEQEKKELEQNLSDMQDFFNKYKDYVFIKNSNRHLDVLWQQLDHEHASFRYPRWALNTIGVFQRDCTILAQVVSIIRRIEKEQATATLLEQVDLDKLAENKNILSKLEAEITNLTWECKSLREELNLVLRYQQTLKLAFEQLKPQILNTKEKIEELQVQRIETIRQECIHELIKTFQSKLAMNEEILSKVDYQKGIVEHLSNQITELELEEIALKRLVDEVSPTNGLIAEGLMAFINTVLDQVNQIIEKVWTYGFVLLPCEFKTDGEVGLTYRFPIDIDDGTNTIRDISEGSKAQKEITDAAFRIIAMIYLGFSDGMLFLDEFGDGFDPTHKASSVHAINTIIEQMSFSQLYMVSHIETSYGALKNNDICVLSDSNIRVQGPINQHVTMY